MTALGRAAGVARWIVGVGAATAVLLLFTLEGAPDVPADAAPSEVDLLVDEGRAIYAQRSATCHGDAGQGGQGPRLAGTVIVNYPDATEQIAIVAGGADGMPAFAGTLSDDEIAAVVGFTRFGLR
ncbi:MAG: c-type cytochrome [Candidatus Hopanoidivoransaceae bacterium]